jgi:hypothetical protein
MMTGLSIGRLTAIGSIVLICTRQLGRCARRGEATAARLHSVMNYSFLNAGLIDDALEQSNFLGRTRPESRRQPLPAPGSRIVKFFLHFMRCENFERFLFEHFTIFRVTSWRAPQERVGCERRIRVAGLDSSSARRASPASDFHRHCQTAQRAALMCAAAGGSEPELNCAVPLSRA